MIIICTLIWIRVSIFKGDPFAPGNATQVRLRMRIIQAGGGMIIIRSGTCVPSAGANASHLRLGLLCG